MVNRRRFTLALLVTAGLTCFSYLPTDAMAAGKEVVKFRLQSWKALHVDDADEAQKLYKTLKKIGCEATHDSHGNHYDVRYRCAKWRQLALSSHSDAHRWENWLKKIGFETQHEH